ncbi:hypothetical protein BDV29DRAFT_175167 [Aspergillus leporis]|uniref:Uncharacterized protein n=1 Tax=Aspergillus leporis TaxID=41062 RepID=A0A5N5X2U6_9EURO|nr:hypothetical protein BDV29DRAFT_175167 [Aspergillus leporis]
MASSVSRVASQSVCITTSPIPKSLAESKLLLAALQKFGEVVTFRNLQYDTTNTSQSSRRATLAIFESPTAATQAIASSPLTILLPESQSQSQTKSNKPSPDPWASAESVLQAARPTYLTCTIEPSRHNHESALRRNPFHTSFHVSKTSIQHHDLVRTGIPMKELADVPMARKEYESVRVKKRVQGENEKLGATSLVGLFESGIGSGNKEIDGEMEVD